LLKYKEYKASGKRAFWHGVSRGAFAFFHVAEKTNKNKFYILGGFAKLPIEIEYDTFSINALTFRNPEIS
jgi:hypothetical protein